MRTRRKAKAPPAHSAPPSGARAPRAGRGNAFRASQVAGASAGTAEGAARDTTAERATAAAEVGQAISGGSMAPGVEEATAAEEAAPQRLAGQKIDAATSAQFYASIRATTRGAALMAELERGPTPELTWSGQGSYMTGGNVWLDVELAEDDLVGVLVHELQHVLNERTGRTGDLSRDDRATYVQNTLQDETSAQTALILHDLQAGGRSAESKSFMHHLRLNHPDVLRAIQAGGAEVDWGPVETLAAAYAKDKFENVYRTSTSGETYPEYYGGSWDRARGATTGAEPQPTGAGPVAAS